MAWRMHLCVATDEDLDAFAQRLGQLLGRPLKRVEEGGQVRWELAAPDPHVDVLVYENDFVNDKDVNFEDYQIVISVRAWRLPGSNEADWKAWREGFARTVYERLKETGRYGLMFVDGVQTKLDEYRPAERVEP
jgi:hypothetical protein